METPGRDTGIRRHLDRENVEIPGRDTTLKRHREKTHEYGDSGGDILMWRHP